MIIKNQLKKSGIDCLALFVYPPLNSSLSSPSINLRSTLSPITPATCPLAGHSHSFQKILLTFSTLPFFSPPVKPLRRQQRLGIPAPQPARRERRRGCHPRRPQKHRTRYRLAPPRRAPPAAVPHARLRQREKTPPPEER